MGTSPSESVRSAVSQALGRPALDSEIALRPVAPHQSNRLYDVHAEGEHLIAKEYLREDLPEAARHEYAALHHVESLRLAPEPVFFDPSVARVVVYRSRRTPSGQVPARPDTEMRRGSALRRSTARSRGHHD